MRAARSERNHERRRRARRAEFAAQPKPDESEDRERRHDRPKAQKADEPMAAAIERVGVAVGVQTVRAVKIEAVSRIEVVRTPADEAQQKLPDKQCRADCGTVGVSDLHRALPDERDGRSSRPWTS